MFYDQEQKASLKEEAIKWVERKQKCLFIHGYHFKGGEYEVIGVAKDSETLAPVVVYRALYGDGEIWVRDAEMWLETVERDGKRMPRFTPVL